MEKEIKTIEQWLNELPEPYRTQAIENTLKHHLNHVVNSLKCALAGAFVWKDSEQGLEYWENLFNSL